MPALDRDNPGVAAVATFGSLIRELIQEAAPTRIPPGIEPALTKSDFDNFDERVSSALLSSSGAPGGPETQALFDDRQFAVIEIAARELFSQLIATTSIDSPEFGQVWILLDILSILSEKGPRDACLLLWLVEELLESQTISGCRKVFDFLESRRERIVAYLPLPKKMSVLRSCNELLRRLSRAEDTAFCGRVFIFMFQSFPLHDKSSVNMRGEYHVENVTTYEMTSTGDDTRMDVDEENNSVDIKPEQIATAGDGLPDQNKSDASLKPDALYPIFWSLQESFSQPKKLFDRGHLQSFRRSLETTMKAFQAVPNEQGSLSSKSAEDPRRNLKRKREDGEDDNTADAFNPKYLTSRDLFELEISDLSFRRHVLVQALIIMDFLIHLRAESQEKIASLPTATNRAVMFMDHVQNDDDIKWANDMKKTIAEYLKQGADGPYFFRMVETVLTRDKNWVRWKIGGCQPIKRNPVSPASFIEAKNTVQRNATSKRLRPVPMGAVSLDFLRSEDDVGGMNKLKAKERYQLPELNSFERKIADDVFEIDMPTSNQSRAAAVAGKASKSWRALRIAGRYKLAAFDKIDDPKNVNVVFEELVEADEDEDEDEPTASEEEMPSNRDPVVISGLPCVGKSAVIEKLLDLHKGVFMKVIGHTTREPEEGEINGKTWNFVKAQEFNQLRDGDRLMAYSTIDGVNYGISYKAIEAVTETGKIPVIELDVEAARFAKDMDFQARYILTKPTSPESLAERLQKRSRPDSDIQDIVKSLPAAADDPKTSDVFAHTLVNDDIDKTAAGLANVIFEKEETVAELHEGVLGANEDARMNDASAEEPQEKNPEKDALSEKSAGSRDGAAGEDTIA